jgi:hypothetical protein
MTCFYLHCQVTKIITDDSTNRKGCISLDILMKHVSEELIQDLNAQYDRGMPHYYLVPN